MWAIFYYILEFAMGEQKNWPRATVDRGPQCGHPWSIGETMRNKVTWTHHRDKLVVGPTLHQVSDVDEDRSGYDGDVNEVTWTAPHLRRSGVEVNAEASECQCRDTEEKLPAGLQSSGITGWCCHSLSVLHSAAGPAWSSRCPLEGSKENAVWCHSQWLQVTQ